MSAAGIQTFDYSVDLLRAIIWQYNDAAAMQSLLSQKQAWYDQHQRDFWSAWCRDVFDLRTANEFGCAVWSIILDQPLVANINASRPDYPAFGFDAKHRNFSRGNFASAGGSQALTVDQRRMLLQMRYRQLVSRGTVPEINAMLADLMADYGRVYVRDNYDMTMTYVFGFEPPAALLQVFDLFDILPSPAGVKINRLTPAASKRFGFGSVHKNFDHGTFAG